MVPCGDASSRSDIRQDQRYLQFWTRSAFFYLKPANEHIERSAPDLTIGRRSERYLIQDVHTDTVGTIVLHYEWDKVLGTNPNTPQEFIAISDAMWLTKEELPRTFYSHFGQGDAEWAVYNVMLLGYDEDPDRKRIARRVGLGKIWKQAFDNACDREDRERDHVGNHHPSNKAWKEIILG